MRINIFILLILITTGCQSDNIEEVINDFPEIHNLDALNNFVTNVQNGTETEITYIATGIEGQRGEKHLKYNGHVLKVSHYVDGDFIEEYKCNKISIEQFKDFNNYILSECSGNFKGEKDFTLISVTNDKKVHLN